SVFMLNRQIRSASRAEENRFQEKWMNYLRYAGAKLIENADKWKNIRGHYLDYEQHSVVNHPDHKLQFELRANRNAILAQLNMDVEKAKAEFTSASANLEWLFKRVSNDGKRVIDIVKTLSR